MKKNRTAALLLLVLGMLTVVYFVFVKPSGLNETDFAIPSAGEVTSFTLEKIALGVKTSEVKVARDEKGGWIINDKFSGNESRVNDLLKTASVVHVIDEIADLAQRDALEILKKNHTVATFYHEGRILKKYLIGSANNSQTGNLMMLEGAEHAYVVARPGVAGYISVQYSTELDTWREKLLFNAKGEEIKLVSLTFGADSLAPLSWRLHRETASSPWKVDGVTTDVAPPAEAYMSYFTGKVFAEGFASAAYPGMADSLQQRKPDFRLYIETLDGSHRGIVLFGRPDNPNNYFGWVEGERELYTIQHFVIDKYLVPVDYFRLPPG